MSTWSTKKTSAEAMNSSQQNFLIIMQKRFIMCRKERYAKSVGHLKQENKILDEDAANTQLHKLFRMKASKPWRENAQSFDNHSHSCECHAV